MKTPFLRSRAGAAWRAAIVPSLTPGDGLLLCGGEDIDPDRYSQKNCGSLGIDPDRDAAEFARGGYAAAGKYLRHLPGVPGIECGPGRFRSRTSDRSGTCSHRRTPARMWTESTRCGQRKTPCSAAFQRASLFLQQLHHASRGPAGDGLCASRPGRKSGLQKRSNTKLPLFFCAVPPSE